MLSSNQEFYDLLRADLESKLNLLEDKPEESIESTFKALGFAALGLNKSAALADELTLPELTDEQKSKLLELVGQRLGNTPLAHITGRQNFMGIELMCDHRALIPRKETEILGQKALQLSLDIARSKQSVYIIDACCGAGNLSLAIATFNPNAYVCGTDISHEAVALTQENIAFLNLGDRVNARQGDLLSAFENEAYLGNIDLIVCNPPYISSAKVQKMNVEILAHEPALAFDGGALGVNLIQRLLRESPKFLTESGWLIFEVGVGQGPFVLRLCEKDENFSHVESVSDELGNIRVIAARK